MLNELPSNIEVQQIMETTGTDNELQQIMETTGTDNELQQIMETTSTDNELQQIMETTGTDNDFKNYIGVLLAVQIDCAGATTFPASSVTS